MLGDGRLHLTAIAMLAPYLTAENRDTLLKRATHRTKRQIEELIAEMTPRPDVPAVVRKLPTRRTPTLRPVRSCGTVLELGPDAVARSSNSVQTQLERRSNSVHGVAPRPFERRPRSSSPWPLARYKVQFTASAELKDKLERLRALMRSKVPDGDLAAIIEEAVTEKLERLEARRFAKMIAAPEGARGDQPLHFLALHPGPGEARGERTRRTEVPLRGLKGPTMPGARPARVSPPVPLCLGR